ncbi:MAG TPA: aldo/keto reductase [Candidatus Binatia bacterium]|nr:aldo/keto reductase [Candidatus Binatia bacterium]
MDSKLSMYTTIRLNDGKDMPVLGFGVARMAEGTETEQSVLWALEAGYRLIDTAKIYGNEASVGRAVRKSGIPREEIFITTKLWPNEFFRVRAALQKSLDKLGLAYIDLYLIHWPVPLVRGGIWKDFEKIYAAGLVRSIGVSNYSVKQLEPLVATAEILPAVNQVLFHPFFYKKELLDYCSSKNIAVEAYSPLAKGRKLNDPVIAKIAGKYGKAPAQIMIRWSLQHGLIPIPKSSDKKRIFENAKVFDFCIEPDDMKVLDNLN